MCDGEGLRGANRSRHTLYSLLAKFDWGEQAQPDVCWNQRGCATIVTRRIVLVNGLYGHPVWAGSNGFGECGTPVQV
jgi:hypothetical protein